MKPWEAKKLYGLAAANAGNLPERVVIDGTVPLSRSGDSARDIAAEAAGLLFDGPVALPNARVFHLRESRLPEAGKHTHLLQGIVLANGGTARRDQTALTPADLVAIEERIKGAEARRHLEVFSKPDFKAFGGPDRLMGQLGTMLKELPADYGAAAAFALASNYAKAGQWDIAHETFLLMVNRYPSHPLALDAYRWLAPTAVAAKRGGAMN